MKQIFYGCCLLLLAACSDRPQLVKPDKLADSASHFTATIENDNQPADNYSYIKVWLKAQPQSGFDPDAKVTFSIDHGSFADNSTVYHTGFSSDSTAWAMVRTNTPGVVAVTALIGSSYVVNTTLHFALALPATITIEPDSAILQSSFTSASLVKATLRRSPGSPSANQQVIFSDSTSLGTSIGSFMNTVTSDANGVATAKYQLQDTSYHGYVYLKGTVIRDSIRITGFNRIWIP